MLASEQLARLGLALPPVPAPVAAYVPAVRVADFVFTSGQVPIVEGRLRATGLVGAEVDPEEAYACARVAVLNALAAVAEVAGGVDAIARIVKMVVFVAAAPGFEMMGTRYVGAGVLASAIGMDKHFMKLVLSASGLPIGPFVSITPAEWTRDPTACLEAVAALSHPLFVKPARGGSSLGISRVDDPSGLTAAIELAQRHDPKIIVEQGFVGARELECGVLAELDGAGPRASAVAEIRVARDGGFYDFEAKYLPDEQVGLDVPADIDPETADEVRRLAVRTFEAIGCEGLARVDMFWTADGSLVVNEINTMPGFTPHSMFPRMWAASGVAYPELVEHLIRLAQQRPLGLR